MPLVHRQVDGLADGAAGMVDPGRGIGELHEIAEILDRAVAPALLQIAHEGRTVGWREDGVGAADLDRSRRVTGVLGELRWRALLDEDRKSTRLNSSH